MQFELLAQLIVSGIVLGSFYALLGVSFGLVYQTSKIFHLANAIPFAAAAYGAVWSASTLRFPLWLALIFGLLMAVIFGLLILVLGYFPVMARNGTLLALFLVSLGISVAFPNLLQIVFGTENLPLKTYGADGELGSAFDNNVYTWGFVTITTIDILKIVVAWLVVLGVVLFVNRTRLVDPLQHFALTPPWQRLWESALKLFTLWYSRWVHSSQELPVYSSQRSSSQTQSWLFNGLLLDSSPSSLAESVHYWPRPSVA